MSDERAISAHYRHGHLLQAIESALDQLGKTPDSVTIADLAPVDEFHIGGRVATAHLLSPLGFGASDHLLDIGCGLGGAARFVATEYGSRVSGIDLTEEYIETGTALCAWLKLDDKVTLRRGSALSLPFDAQAFDGAYMLHVGMNIGDKPRLFAEIHRVLRPGAALAIYDIMRVNAGALAYPVPWAQDDATSLLDTAEQYRQALAGAGFEVSAPCDRRDFALEFFNKLREKTATSGPAPLGFHTLMKDSTASKLKNMIDNIVNGYIAPIEIVAHKPE